MALSKFQFPEDIELDSEFRIRDAMARLITGGDVCAALCVYDNHVLVSSNSYKNDKLTQNYFDFFRTVANSGFTKKEIEQDFRNTISGTMEDLVERSIQHFIQAKEDQPDVGPLRERIQQLKLASDPMALPQDRKAIIDSEVKILQDLLEKGHFSNKTHKDITDRIGGLQGSIDKDGNIITSIGKVTDHVKGIEKRLNTLLGTMEIPALRERLTIDIQKVVGSLAVDSIHPLPSDMVNAIRNEVEFISGKVRSHAEMNLINHIIEDREKRDLVNQEDIYIGISKLCCADCHKTINLLNNEFQEAIGVNIDIRGGHGNKQNERIDPPFVNEIFGFKEALSKAKLDDKLEKNRRRQEADKSDSEPEIDNLSHMLSKIRDKVGAYMNSSNSRHQTSLHNKRYSEEKKELSK